MKKFVPVIIGLGVIALGVLVWQFLANQKVEGGVSSTDLTMEIPKAREDGPDFGPLEDKYIMGKTPGGPGAPGAAPGTGKGGK